MAGIIQVDSITNNAGTGAPNFPFGLTSAVAPNYFLGTMPTATSWSTSSTTFVNPTVSGVNTLTTLSSSVLAVTAAASNALGITFTPNKSTALYLISASFSGSGSALGKVAFRFSDGTIQFASNVMQNDGGATVGAPVLLYGLYAPGTASPITINIQVASNTTGSVGANSYTNVPSVTWNVLQIF